MLPTFNLISLDFFHADHVWNEAFPLEAPFKITMPSSFTVMSKEHVVPIEANRFKIDPADADYSYVAKVSCLALIVGCLGYIFFNII